MSNEHHDLAARNESCDLAMDAVHGMAPDEILMRMEEGAYARAAMGDADALAAARCLLSLLTAITWQVTCTRQIRDRLAVVASMWAPDLMPGDNLWAGRVEWAQVREEMGRCAGVEWQDSAGRVMIGLLTTHGWSPREVGMRALCMLYAFQPNAAARPLIAQSFAAIGEAIGLTAENKRSAVSAAMKRIVSELLHRMERLTKTRGTGEFWFNKRGGCKAALSAAMMGKQNRLKAKEAVPVKEAGNV